MFGALLKKLFTTRYGGYVIVALVLVGAAAAGKMYYQEVATPEPEREASSVEEYLDSVEEALSAFAATRKDGESPFPADAPWTPAQIECGTAARASAAESDNPTWKVLGLPLDQETRYQFRFRSQESAWHLMARTDSDCDGIYKVFHLRGTSGWEGIRTQPLKIDNPGE